MGILSNIRYGLTRPNPTVFKENASEAHNFSVCPPENFGSKIQRSGTRNHDSVYSNDTFTLSYRLRAIWQCRHLRRYTL